MPHRFRLPLLVVAMLLPAWIATAQDGAVGGSVDWSTDLTAALASAKATGKILMIAVNAKQVDGSSRIEPAAKGLREIVYKDARVVAKSREFVCAMLTPSSNSSEYGELRLLGIDGALVSPQHIFVHPDGTRILVRKQYWSHGSGEAGVQALLALMDEAKAKLAGADAAPAETPADVGAPPEGDRTAWIQERIREVAEAQRPAREKAIAALVRHDRDGDCTTPLLALLAERRKDDALVFDVLRGLGRDQLLAVAPPVAEYLTHKEPTIRGAAAVTLEYIGSPDKAVVAALLRAAGKERDEAIANHMCRALGRCGAKAGEAKARSLLLKKSDSAKTDFGSYGPLIGLAYFEGDAKAARGVEKMLKKIGIPGGRRGAGQNTIKRGVMSWTLASIADKKSGDFVRTELLEKLENVQAFWVGGLKTFYRNVAKCCDGDASAMPAIEQGVRGIVGFATGAGVELPSMIDQCRKDRADGNFTPKGEELLGSAGDT